MNNCRISLPGKPERVIVSIRQLKTRELATGVLYERRGTDAVIRKKLMKSSNERVYDIKKEQGTSSNYSNFVILIAGHTNLLEREVVS